MALSKVMYRCLVIGLLFLFSGYSLAQEFELGAWCLTGHSSLNLIIDEDPAGSENYVLLADEKDLLEDLSLNYMIACTRGQGLNATTHGEEALNNYGIERDGAFKSTMEISPANSESITPYQVWLAIDDSTGGPNSTAWCAYVDSGFVSMDTLHSDKTGVHSFLAGAEHQMEDSARYSWLDYICESIHDNATNVQSLVQDGYDSSEYLDSLFSAVDAMDIFNYHYYVLRDTTDSSGTNFQDALDNFVYALDYAQTELESHYGEDGVPLHFITQAHYHPNEYRLARKEEILCQNNLSLAYGAKGIVYYLYGSLYGGVDGLVDLYRNTTAQYDSIQSIHDNYQGTGNTFYEIGSEFIDLTWKTGITVHDSTSEPINATYDIYDITSRIPQGAEDDEDSTFIEIGVLQDASDDNYYMVVNRRCLNGERDVTVTFESTSNHAYLLTDIFTDTEIHFLPAAADTFSYSFTLGSGEARLLKLEDLGEFSGSIAANTIWRDIYYIGGDITVESGINLSITANTQVLFLSGDAQSGGSNSSKSEIIVEGELKADDATFEHVDRTKGGWQGIYFENGCDATSWIDGCTIQDAYYGVHTYEDISIDTTEFNNIDFAGIKVLGEAEPTVRECKIEADAVGVYIYRGSGTYQHIDFEGPYTDSVGSGVYALGSDNTDFSHCDFDLATTANNGTYNRYTTSIDVVYSNMEVPGAAIII